MLAVRLLRSGKNQILLNKLCFLSCTQIFQDNVLHQKSHFQLTSINQQNQGRYFHVSVIRKNMEDSVKLIGAGIAATGVIGPGIGMGIIFGNYLLGASRNPSFSKQLFQSAILGAALCESLGLFALIVAFIAAL